MAAAGLTWSMRRMLWALRFAYALCLVSCLLALALILVETPRAQAWYISNTAMAQWRQDIDRRPDGASLRAAHERTRQALLAALQRDPWQMLHWRRLEMVDQALGDQFVLEAARARTIAAGFHHTAHDAGPP